jgi:MFS family permease
MTVEKKSRDAPLADESSARFQPVMTRASNRPWFGLLTIGLGASISPTDFAVNVAFPAITAAFALDVPAIRWVVISYVITYASLMLAFGKLGDIIGHRTVFRAGLIASTLAFAACGLAPTYAWLLAARALQGIAIALVLSCAPALIVAACGEQRRTWALSRYTMTAAVAGIIGPLAGGAAIELLGWTGVFWFRLPVALLALVLLARLPACESPAPSPRHVDIVSSALLAAGLALVLLAPALWPGAVHAAWPLVIGVAGALLLILFARRERGHAEPILPAAALRDPAVRLSNLTSILVNLVGFAIPLLVPYYLARIGGFSATAMGALLALATVGVLASSTLAPRIVRALGQHRSALLGAALTALAQGLIAFWPAAPTLLILAPGLLLHGLGVGLFQVSYTDFIVATLRARDRGVAGSLTVLTRTIGVIAAAVILTSVLQALEARHLASGLAATEAFHAAFRTVFLSSGLLLAAFVAFSAFRGTR